MIKIMIMRRKLRGFSRWVFKKKARKLKVKIVHPGGHVELHSRPVLASEIMLRNPRCCVTHPHIFKQPWAIVSPDTTLFPGEKFYVVPFGTIRKLQKLSTFNTSPVLGSHNNVKEPELDRGQKTRSLCFYFFKVKNPFFLLKQGRKKKGNRGNGRNFGGQVRSASSSSHGSSSSDECTTGFIRKRSTRKGGQGPVRRLASFDNWQPNLEIISEE